MKHGNEQKVKTCRILKWKNKMTRGPSSYTVVEKTRWYQLKNVFVLEGTIWIGFYLSVKSYDLADGTF